MIILKLKLFLIIIVFIYMGKKELHYNIEIKTNPFLE